MKEEEKPNYFLGAGNPGPCPLCEAAVTHLTYFNRDDGSPKTSGKPS